MLGIKNKTGKKIFNKVKNLSNKYFKVCHNIILYRCREHDNPTPLSFKQMLKPAYGIPSQQRFNTSGDNVLYMSDSLDAAKSEFKNNVQINILKVRLIKETKLLNISENECPLFDFCHNPATNNNKNIEQSYLVPNFLANCCNYHGITGIIYKNTKIKSNKNYVFFHNDEKWFDKIDILSENT